MLVFISGNNVGELADAWLKVGIGGFTVLLLAYTLLWHVIPHWKAKDTKEQEFRHNQIKRVQDREDQIIKEMTNAIRENTVQSHIMGQHIESLTETVRDTRRK